MLRDFKFLRRKNPKSEEPENVNPREPSVAQTGTDSSSSSCSRPPLNTIQEPHQNPSKPDQESGLKSKKVFKTPTKAKSRYSDYGVAMRTPEKHGGVSARNRHSLGPDEARIGDLNTPRSCRSAGRAANLHHSECNATPSKTVCKPPNPGGSSKPPAIGGARIGNSAALPRRIPAALNAQATVNTARVPHFELREDPSFWMDHNVQVLIRIRPLNGMEIGAQGYKRCLKQENAQCLTWVGAPETRFTFDHVACETIDQETIFRMVGLPMVENCLSGYNSCMFAYGQTGSGKTHTMLGEINDLEGKPSPYRGMTPRMFECLFARISADEESRRDENLTYNCKCSFLEIYNEQITDLLDPSSTNLQLREDVNKGVYVENLSEFEVLTVGDILRLLSKGSANRRVAATNMNKESSRSHSVFTCVIESRWEKDSTSNLRFARLNLVDLAGSERQKTSGAEGERLKEAANINKSLSTLGHVIMVLVDGVNARTRHVPYRDSRLTFLLQDSLGGNSKTMIIANVSPSICSAAETLNTLKFAQRAKLIQNNAVVNEDALGDVVALQNQIRLLKEELAILKRHNISKSLTFHLEVIEEARQERENHHISALEKDLLKVDNVLGHEEKVLRVSSKQLKSLETSLTGALRREQKTETSIKQLEAEIEQLTTLVRQREEENRCTKMMLKFREDKIHRMESLLSGSIPADSYFLEENNMLTEEIRMLRGKVDRNPEVTRFAMENIRLLEQLRRFQDFYEEGEREMLLTEVSELRDQLVLFLDENSKQDDHLSPSMKKETTHEKQENDSLESELKTCQNGLEKCRGSLNSCLEQNAKLCREIVDLNALLENQQSRVHEHEGDIEVIKEPILEASSVSDRLDHTVQKKNETPTDYTEKVMDLEMEVDILKTVLKEEKSSHFEKEESLFMITKECEKLKGELQDAKSVVQALQTQQESSSLLQEKLDVMDECNKTLSEKYEEKDRQLNTLREEWDYLVIEMEEVLATGHEALEDASNQLDARKTWVSEKLQIISRSIIEKDLRVKELNSCLEDAKTKGNEMECMLRSLRGATLVMSEAHQRDCSEKDQEIRHLSSQLNEKSSTIAQLGLTIKQKEEEIKKASDCAIVGFVILNRFSELLAQKEAELEGFRKERILRTQKEEKMKDQEIHKLSSQLSEKSSTIAQLGLTIKQKEEQIKKASDCETVGFVILTRFSELLAQKEAELEEFRKEKEEMMKDKDEEFRCLEEKFVTDLWAKDIDVLILSSKLEQLGSQRNNLEKEKIVTYTILERFKEDMIVCYMDIHEKDWILQDKEAEVSRLQKEIEYLENLAKEVISEDLNLESEMETKDEIEELTVSLEALECEIVENIVKGQAFEAQLKEKVDIISTLEAEISGERESVKLLSSEIQMLSANHEDAIKAQESTEQQLAETKKANEQEVIELKRQLNEFVVERKRWLEELERRQVELVASHEHFRQRDNLLTTENQKLKEENCTLKTRIDELSCKLSRADAMISRFKEELVKLHASNGQKPHTKQP